MIYSGGMRWSQTKRAWCGLFRVLADGRIYCGYELTWWQKTPEFAAADLLAFCKEKGLTLQSVVAQPDIFPKAGEVGETVSETFLRAGVPIRPGSKDRLACWSRLRSWLALRQWSMGQVGPSLLIHPDCKRLRKTIPSLVHDENEPDDVDETPDEYPAYGAALFAMSRPNPWEQPKVETEPDPLSGAYLWNQLRNMGHEEARLVGWNRRR